MNLKVAGRCVCVCSNLNLAAQSLTFPVWENLSMIVILLSHVLCYKRGGYRLVGARNPVCMVLTELFDPQSKHVLNMIRFSLLRL